MVGGETGCGTGIIFTGGTSGAFATVAGSPVGSIRKRLVVGWYRKKVKVKERRAKEMAHYNCTVTTKMKRFWQRE
jgi:hypothetical protein